MKRKHIIGIFIYRISLALLTRSIFQPDEFFQSLEVAHNVVFGYGKLTWEWQPSVAIRSIVYPTLYVPAYWILRVTGLDSTALLVYAPKVLSGAIAALTDIWVCELARQVLGERHVTATGFLSLTSFFHGMSLTRSMSNSLETSLTIIALSYHPWSISRLSDGQWSRKSLFFAALTCTVRPTAAITWVFLYSVLLWRLRHDLCAAGRVFFQVAYIGLSITTLLYYADSAFYGRLVFTPLNFMRTNLSSISLIYGRNLWHYYFTQAIPILCASSLPLVVKGLYLGTRDPHHSTNSRKPKSSKSMPHSLKILAGTVLWTIAVYSLSGHKEWRFIHPMLPILHIFAAKALVESSKSNSTEKQASAQGDFSRFIRAAPKSYLTLLLLQLPVILYCIAYRSSPQVSVMGYLRSLSRNSSVVRSIGFLMPCHSTPWQSHLHNPQLDHPGRLWAIGCEPPLQGQDVDEYKDQTDIFYESPLEYLKTRFPPDVDLTFPPSSYPSSPPGLPEKLIIGDGDTYVEESEKWKHEWPEYLVMFGHLLDSPGIREYLTKTMWYKVVWRAGYGFDEESNRSGGVFVLKAPLHHRPLYPTSDGNPKAHQNCAWDSIHNHERLTGHSH
ncbi:hypothetical protein BDM02DRAFT_3094507 [Thelephora ganbajun]|uniref:Uncharacterized protein n=1 Tax=Thelephora ganbajun TaxID=370292 RepID=A0ACB6ZIR0_THEGA|nr:hypothetical protein BDM02DRAFT_3094507 [Thelephora ganbajun]